MSSRTQTHPPHLSQQTIGDIRHWMKNNFQILSSLLSMQGRSLSDDAALKVCRKTQGWTWAVALALETSGSLSRHSEVDLAAYTQRLMNLLESTYEIGEDLEVLLRAGPALIDADRAISYGLILNELIANAFTHAFPDGRKGRVSVQLQLTGDVYRLTVSDDGVGLPVSVDPPTAESLGFWLVNELAQQLGATYEVKRDQGTEITLAIPRARN